MIYPLRGRYKHTRTLTPVLYSFQLKDTRGRTGSHRREEILNLTYRAYRGVTLVTKYVSTSLTAPILDTFLPLGADQSSGAISENHRVVNILAALEGRRDMRKKLCRGLGGARRLNLRPCRTER